jgi:G3E family GTPase
VTDSPTIPLIILTGFLGAGKTTVLNRVLGAQQRRRVAVLVNELGRIDIDAGLVRSRAGDVLELSGGCVCHQIGVQRELWSALDDIVRRSRPDIVVLETTGIAEPDAIVRGLDELAADSSRDASAVRVSSVVTVVDAEAGLGQLARHDEARDQVRSADRVLLTKLDRLSSASDADATNLAELHRQLHQLNPVAERVAFPAGDAGTADLVSWLLQAEFQHRRNEARAPHRHGHGHQLAAASFVDDAPLLADAVLLVCAALGDRLVRAKGFVHLANQPRRAFLERAGAQTSLSLGEPWGDEPRQTRVVLIGEGLDEAALQRQLWACRAPFGSASTTT